MTYYNDNLHILEKKLNEKTRDFNNFKDISDSDIAKIDELIKARTDESSKETPTQKYYSVLAFLTHSRIHSIIPNPDCYALYLIKALDEDLVALKTYLSYSIPSLSETELPSESLRATLQEKSQNAQKKAITSIRRKIGFFNKNLIKFEYAYFNKYIRTKQLLSIDHQESLNHLLGYVKKGLSLDSISDEDIKRLFDITVWYQDTNLSPNFQNVAFNIVYQSQLLGLKTVAEQLAFLIMNCDQNLVLLRIYEEESRLSEIKKRAIEELGFYDPRLITLEASYQKRIMPDTKISIWSI